VQHENSTGDASSDGPGGQSPVETFIRERTLVPGLLVSPTEPQSLRAIGAISSVPEQLGADFAWTAANGDLCGIQRKELKDLLASVRDGRLPKEIAQMQALAYKALIVEGRQFFSPDGTLLLRYESERWTQESLWALFMSIQAEGLAVFATQDTHATARCIATVVHYSNKPTHRALRTRPKAPKDRWGDRSSARWATWVLQAWEGIGPDVAAAIVKHFGTLPLRWTVTEQEFRGVPGVGKLRAKRLWESLNK
jgi:ERCC4-type nuclease